MHQVRNRDAEEAPAIDGIAHAHTHCIPNPVPGHCSSVALLHKSLCRIITDTTLRLLSA